MWATSRTHIFTAAQYCICVWIELCVCVCVSDAFFVCKMKERKKYIYKNITAATAKTKGNTWAGRFVNKSVQRDWITHYSHSSEALCTSNFVGWFCILSTYIRTFAPHYVYDIWHIRAKVNEQKRTAHSPRWSEQKAKVLERVRRR